MIFKRSSILVYFIVTAQIIIFSLSGCVPSKPTEEVELIPSERLVKKLEANRRKVKNFEGTGNIDISTKDFSGTADFRAVLIRPDSLYVEFYGPFGIDLAQALITNRNYQFYDIMHNTLYTGKNSSSVLKKVLKIDLSFSDIMDALIGSVNLTPKLQQNPDKYEIDYNKYVLTYTDSLTGFVSKYRVDIRDLAVTGFEMLDKKNTSVLNSTFSKFKTLENIPVPYHSELSTGSGRQNLKIDYRKISLNKKNVSIRMSVPDDVQVVRD